MVENRILVAVYGSLRKNLGNHRLLETSEYLGEFTTKPEYSLYSLGGFPGLKEKGTTAVVMEVYSVTPQVDLRLDMLEGYDRNSNDNTFYDKKTIETPFGTAGVYVYVPSVQNRDLVVSGDWKEYYTNKYATI